MQSFRFSNVCFWSYLTRTILEIILRYFIIVKIISDCPNYFVIVKIISQLSKLSHYCQNYLTIVKFISQLSKLSHNCKKKKFTIVNIILFIRSVLACSWSTGVGGCQTWKPILTATSTESGGESNFSAMLILGVGSEEGLDWIISSQCTASQRNVSKTLFHVFIIFCHICWHQAFSNLSSTFHPFSDPQLYDNMSSTNFPILRNW